MILDDLFSKAATDYKSGKHGITVQAVVTKNQTGGINSKTNDGSVEPQVKLGYTPQESFVGASFSNTNPPIRITAEAFVVPGQLPYGLEILGKSFVPAVDAETQIVYGAAGGVFVTISLCGYDAFVVPT
jgi:hypothetical protein